tara:strand:- start:7 stop:636 length:630 start_codon:yes stop_codon:yes gene_type:complete
MAQGDTSVSICNKSLLLLGAESITSFTDGTASSQACATVYDMVVNSTLGLYSWSFTVAKIQLAQSTATPVSEWRHQYILPPDMLTGVPRAVRTSASAYAPLVRAFEINQGGDGLAVLMTNETSIFIDYQKAVAEAQMPPYFSTLLVYQIAWHLAEVITDQTTKSEYWRAISVGTPNEGMRGGYFRQAMNMDSAGNPPQVISDYILTDIR